jgi:dihydropteroate synthase
MQEIGVDPGGIALMAPKGKLRLVRIENLSAWQANLLKQEMLSLGGDAAVNRGAIDCSAKTTSALLLGTDRHLGALLEKLKSQPPTMREIGVLLRDGLARYGRRRFSLDLGGRRLELGARTMVMGILNATPDSFYDGGRHDSPAAAVEHGLRLAEEGADIIDVGGESSRPGAGPVAVEDELERVVPVVRELARRCDTPISVDTTKAEVARAALDAGAVMVNDISALRSDPDMAGAVASSGAAAVLMHMRGEPRTMQENPEYGNVMAEIVTELGAALAAAAAAGVDPERLLVDPGIGFGKTAAHNVAIQRGLGELRVLGRPVVFGSSRKSFIGALGGGEAHERLSGSIASACLAALEGAHIVRVHDVGETRRALAVTDAAAGRTA